jgi:branched-chain amino acid transport system substrate-binding protein
MKKLFITLLACLMILGFTACGEDNEKSDTAADADGNYHIAVSLPFTGSNASYAEYIKRGLEIGLKHLEEDGGLNGTGAMLVLDYYDDQNDATEGANIASKICESTDPYYLLEIGSFSSSVSLPCASIYNDAQVPQYALTCSHSDFLKSTDWGFSLSMTQDVAAARVAAYDVSWLGYKNIAVIYTNSEWGNQCVTYYTACAEKLGATIVTTEKYDEGTNDFTSTITKLKQLNPELVMAFCGEDDIVYMIKQANDQGFDVQWQVSSKSRTSNVLENLGDLGEGLYGIYAADKDFSNPVYKRYYDTYMSLYPDEKSTQKYADQGYNCLLTVIWAIENGGTTRETFRDTLSTMHDFMGVQGVLTFAPGRKILQEQYLSRIVRNEKGELEWVNLLDPQEAGFDVDEVAGLK